MAHLSSSSSDPGNLPDAGGVPDVARMRPLALTMAWWAICSGMFYIVIGATLALTYGARNALIGMALSVVSYALVNGIVSRYAIRTGLSVATFSRLLFGSAGAALATLILFVTAIYYAMFEGSVIAAALGDLYPQISFGWAALIVVLYSVPLVFGGVQKWLDKFNGVLLPFYLVGLLVAVLLTTREYGFNSAWLDFGPKGAVPAYGWWSCFVFYMGIWGLMMSTFDFACYGRKADAGFHGHFTFGAPFYLVTFLLNGAAGIYIVSTTADLGSLTEMSVVKALLKLMGVWGLLFVWVTQTRINTANYYLAMVNMQAFSRQALKFNAPRYVFAILVGVAVYALMMADVTSKILQALAWQGVFIVAWVGVAVAHITSAQGRVATQVSVQALSIPAWDRPGLAAWVVGAAAGVVCLYVPSLTAFSAPVSFAVAFVAYRLVGVGRHMPVSATA
ncbi:allantoin permease [Pseudomonas sp. dw_358]|uniref:purine-cytosine permease family protein n=1 Tax=Pseudomonas sp. dw_358 TaxID=2720083 RepID=UPI002116FBC0|nr:allantoin permease [Pseudomonas sp. dw_358]